MKHRMQRQRFDSAGFQQFDPFDSHATSSVLSRGRTQSHGADPLGDDSIDRDKAKEAAKKSARPSMERRAMQANSDTRSHAIKGLKNEIEHYEEIDLPDIHSTFGRKT